ncbi:MAG: hypothetical protein U9N46_10160 [Euryarchaeota archaeon]|nr:MAG: (R)-citramalate synthase CimA [ANME-2 cluster archaeon]MEA1865531.1 hypothetical protein [Euryarchaeota archaeon]
MAQRLKTAESIRIRNLFVHEGGIHTAGVIKNPFTYEPYPPEIIGANRQLLIGGSSGREVVKRISKGLVGEFIGAKKLRLIGIRLSNLRMMEAEMRQTTIYEFIG